MVMADLKRQGRPDWCPGCGDFGVLAAVQKALVELQIQKHEVATISGIDAPQTSLASSTPTACTRFMAARCP